MKKFVKKTRALVADEGETESDEEPTATTAKETDANLEGPEDCTGNNGHSGCPHKKKQVRKLKGAGFGALCILCRRGGRKF